MVDGFHRPSGSTPQIAAVSGPLRMWAVGSKRLCRERLENAGISRAFTPRIRGQWPYTISIILVDPDPRVTFLVVVV